MTRSEIRALILSRLRLFPGALVYDVGAGSGAVAVECALQGGKVYAVERETKAQEVLQSNLDHFNVSLEIIKGEAPQVLRDLPRPHRIFLGGSGGRLIPLLEACHRKLLPGGRLVATAVTLESGPLTYRFLRERGYRREALQVQSSLLQERGGNLLWEGGNPVMVISGEKKGEDHYE